MENRDGQDLENVQPARMDVWFSLSSLFFIYNHGVFLDWLSDHFSYQNSPTDWGCLLVECSPSMHEALGWSCKLDVVVHANNLSTSEVEAGRSEVQCHPQVRRKFRVNLN